MAVVVSEAIFQPLPGKLIGSDSIVIYSITHFNNALYIVLAAYLFIFFIAAFLLHDSAEMTEDASFTLLPAEK